MLGHLSAAFAQGVCLDGAGIIFCKPTSIDDAIGFLQQHPTSFIISGATDLGVLRNKGLRKFSVVMSTAGLKPLREITVGADAMIVGAGVTLTEIERATASCIPELSHFLAYFGSPMIKNAGTIGGNLVNASPIGDTIPALMALGAQIEITGPAGIRWVGIDTFYTGYRKTVLGNAEIVTRIRIPFPDAGDIFRLYKISKRKDLDISSVSAAIRMKTSNDVIQSIQVIFGGVAATVIHLPKTEAMLTGSAVALDSFKQAGAIARNEVKPLSDVRGSEMYRRQLVENILIKFWHDLQDDNTHAHSGNGALR
jgi:xanthine dehydrogenase small subunit